MECVINFVEKQKELMDNLLFLLQCENDCEILLSGTFDNLIYKEIVETIMKTDNMRNTKIIIPLVFKNGFLCRSYINKIFNNGGNIKINSQYRNNVIVIGKYAIILSFSSKYSTEHGLRTYFESAIVTDKKEIIEKIKDNFINMWDNGLPLVNQEA